MSKKTRKKARTMEQPQEAQAVEQVTQIATRDSASELLGKFLSENNIELTISSFEKNVRYVSDGSVIISKPTIGARYVT